MCTSNNLWYKVNLLSPYSGNLKSTWLQKKIVKAVQLNIFSLFILLFNEDHFSTWKCDLILSCFNFLDPLIDYKPVRVWISEKQFKLAKSYL